MATVTGKTSSKIDDLLDDTIVGGELDEDGALTFTTKGGDIINAGSLGMSIVDAVVNEAKHLILTTRAGAEIDAGSIVPDLLAAWPVGSHYFGDTPTNPAVLLGGGTWVRFAEGRMIVGVDSTDSDFDAVGEFGGSKTKTLTAPQLPKHTHPINHDHETQSRDSAGGVASVLAQGSGSGTLEDSSAVKAFNGNSGENSGTAEPVDVMNPYITLYIWKRTA